MTRKPVLEERIPLRRKLAFTAITLAIQIAATLLLVEVAGRVMLPVSLLYPRYRYSERFGHLLRPSATIVEEMPGAWRFVYQTNEYGFRASSMPEISNRYAQPNVVVLGDSVTFGQGVNDGEEYSAVLANLLAGEASVVNLGVPGFGLTHEIRMFYEFGMLFQPSAVVLQFTFNDPEDNFYQMVTTVEHGRFRFHRDRSMGSTMSRVKDWLSGSILQRSAAYNFVRGLGFTYWHSRVVARQSDGDRQLKEALYTQLLRALAEDLQRRGIRLLVFDVPGDLERWPGILSEVEALDRRHLLRHIRTKGWFDGVSDYGTPEGHPWGAKGHRLVAQHLAATLGAALGVLGGE